MSLPTPTGYYRAEAKYAELLRRVGLASGMDVFEHPKIEVWRSITERENCVLDYEDNEGSGRLHIKRNQRGHTGVDAEVDGLRLLMKAGIETVALVAAGRANDGRGFLITEDLAGFADSEKLVQDGVPFERLLEATAAMAGKLHAAGLHHRDLYLCHFYARLPPLAGATSMSPSIIDQPVKGDIYVAPTNAVDLRLMDAGRVRPLPRCFRQRWIIKDVAQFIYSLRHLDVPLDVIERWGALYGTAAGRPIDARSRRAIERKVASIGRHDAKLRRSQPTRNVAIDR